MADKRLEVDIIANDRASRPIKNIQSTIIRFVGAVSASLAALSAVVFPIQSAKEFDRVLRDIQKTTGFTNEEIKVLSGELLTLSKNVDTSANDLGRIAAAAGQLGLGEEGGQAILTFTESIARASTTLDLTAERAATSFAKIASIFNIPITQTENLTSTINELSNTTTATADQLLDVVSRVGTVAGSFEDAAALAAQAIQLGLSPETAGTSLVKIFSNFESKADAFAEEFGITVGDFLGKGAVDRWRFYLDELGKLSEDEAARVINKLSGSGRIFALVDKQVQDAANGYAIFNKAQENAATAFIEGTSALDEYAQVSQSLEVQLGILRNNFAAIGTTIGLRLIPKLIEITQSLGEFLQTTRAQAFFDELSKGFTLLVDGLEAIVDLISTISGGELQNVFFILFGFGVVKVILVFIKILDSAIAKLISFRAAASGSTTTSLGQRILSGIVPALSTLKVRLDSVTTGFNATQNELGETSAAFNQAGVAANNYASAIQTAIVKQAGLAKSALDARKKLGAQTGGAPTSSAVPGAADAQVRVDSILKELALQEQRRQAALKAAQAAKAETTDLQRRLAIIGKANVTEQQRFGTISNGGKLLAKQLRDQISAQQVILRQATERAARLSSSTFQLQRQAQLWKQIQATRQNAALSGLAAAGGGQQLGVVNKQLGSIAAQWRAVGGSIAGAGARARVAAGFMSTLGLAARGLVGALRGIVTVLGGPIGLAITAAIVFWDELAGAIRSVGEALGLVSEAEVALTETMQKEAARQQAIINRRIADYKRLENAVKGGLDIEPAGTADRTDPGGANSLAETGNVLADAANNARLYGGAIRGAAEQVKALEAQQDRVIVRLAQVKTAIDDTNKAGGDTRKLTQEYEDLTKTYEELDNQISQVEATVTNAQIAQQRAGRELAEGFTTGIKSVVDTRVAFLEAGEEAARLELKIKDLSGINISPQILAEADEEQLAVVRQQLTELFGEQIDTTLDGEELYQEALRLGDIFKRQLEEAGETANDLEQDYRKAVAALSPSERAIANQTKILQGNLEELQTIKDSVEGTGQVLDNETDRARYLRTNATEILAQNFAYERQLQALEDQEEQLTKNRKAAQGIFDNTTREVQALVRSLQDVNRNLDDILERRVAERNVARNIETINGNIESRTARIAELEETIANTTDAYVRNKARAEASELRSLNTLDESVRKGAEQRQAQIRLNQLASQQSELFRQAQAAAAAGQTTNFQAIKGQLDNSIKESGSIITDLANLQDADGNFLFREDEIESLQFALNQAAAQYTDAIPALNEDLLEAAKSQEQILADAIKDFQTANKDLVTNYGDLLKEFPKTIGEQIDLIRSEWETANQPLISAIEDFGNSVQQGLVQGQGLDSEGFLDQNAALQEQSLRDSGTLGGTEFDGLVETLTTRFDKSAEDLAAAAKALKLPEGQTLTGLTADPTQLTQDQVKQAFVDAMREVGIGEPVDGGAPAGESNLLGDNFVGDFVDWGGDMVTALYNGARDATSNLFEGIGNYFKYELGVNRADGGPISGAGTSTSDSIPAWLSNGEYVTDAKTVRAMGGFGFFDALKSMAHGNRGSLRSFKAGAPAFRSGGPVTGNSGMAHVTLNLPGVTGGVSVYAEGETVATLQRTIARENLKKGSRRTR